MIDVTQSDTIFSPGGSPAKAPARPSGYLFGPLADFLLLGGGSVVACALLALAFPKGLTSNQDVILISTLMFAINQPHFAHSYQMFYRDFRTKAFGSTYPAALRWRYVMAGMIVPAALIVFLAASAIGGSVRVLSYGANLMFFLVGWHYVKQGYGILIVDSVQKRLMFDDAAKTILRVNGYACWIVAWLGLNHAISKAVSYLDIDYYTLPIPNAVYQAAIATAAATTLAVLFVFARAWRAQRALPWNGVVAYLTTLYLWVIFVHINPLVLVVVPTFHSLQYLAVVWRYQLNAGRARPPSARPLAFDRLWPDGVARRMATFIALGVLLGFLGFMLVPRLIDSFAGYDKRVFGASLFVFMFYIFINVHHYFLDNVMWRRGNPDVQQYIFSRGG